jgi:hypothetical protein
VALGAAVCRLQLFLLHYVPEEQITLATQTKALLTLHHARGFALEMARSGAIEFTGSNMSRMSFGLTWLDGRQLLMLQSRLHILQDSSLLLYNTQQFVLLAQNLHFQVLKISRLRWRHVFRKELGWRHCVPRRRWGGSWRRVKCGCFSNRSGLTGDFTGTW